MDTIIRLRLSELSESVMNRIRKLLQESSVEKNPEISITLHETIVSKTESNLDNSIAQFHEGKVVSFTMDELDSYIRSNFKN